MSDYKTGIRRMKALAWKKLRKKSRRMTTGHGESDAVVFLEDVFNALEEAAKELRKESV